MRTISKRQRQSEKEERTTYLCKEVDPDYLGREVYADNVKTPYSFYLVRKLTLAKDYQNLAEGEAFFDAICDSWDATEEFEELVVKKIYLYVETETMYYTLFMGSFEPTRRELRMNLKQWLEEITLEKQERSLVHQGETTLNSGEIQGMMKQMLETSNEIFRLRKMITDLTETINHGKIEMRATKSDPVISRSIQTIHLKRAQPLVIEENKAQEGSSDPDESVNMNVELVEESTNEAAEIPRPTEPVTKPIEEVEELTEKKSLPELAEKPMEENFQLIDEPTTFQAQESKNEKQAIQIAPVKKERTLIKLKRKQMEQGKQPIEISAKDNAAPKSIAPEPLDLNLLVLKKGHLKKATPSDWPHFSDQLKASKLLEAPAQVPSFSKSEMESLEDEIYLCFMNKRMRLGTKKSSSQKKSILRSELLAQISQAEYLNYSWGQVLRQRKEDVLICERLSCGGLVSSLDDFLQEIREIAYSRSLFGKKVRCSVDLLRRLEGYILMDQYMQNLSLMPVEK